jgi:hypothetical protein
MATLRAVRRPTGQPTATGLENHVVAEIVGDCTQQFDARAEAENASGQVSACAHPLTWSHCRWLAIEADPPLPHAKTAELRS